VQACLQTLAPDAILLINTYSITETDGAHRLAQRVEQIVRASGRPVALCVYTQGDDLQVLQGQMGLPLFGEIEHAVRGLAASRDRYRWQMRQHGEVVQVADAPPDVKRWLSATGAVTTDVALQVCRRMAFRSLRGRRLPTLTGLRARLTGWAILWRSRFSTRT